MKIAHSDGERAAATGLRAIPKSIWALGFVSLFMDTSSELIHSLLPVFLVSVLGASALSVGFIEGVAEATAAITKVFSGTLSDYLGKRKMLTVIGYGLAAVTKPLFPLAGSVALIFTARLIDRIGKGIRGAPRDALIGDIAPSHLRGACYGLRQSLDTVGAFAGPLLAIAFMVLLANDIQAVFWIAVIPAFISVAILIFAVKEPETTRSEGETRSPIRVQDLRRMGAAYWWLVIVGAVLAMARFSEAFLVLRAENIGLSIALVPMVFVVLNAVYAASAYPAGTLSDRMDRRFILMIGFVVLIVADVVLALATGIWLVMAGVVLWGLHMGLTQGLLAAMVADATPPKIRGTAFGIFNLATGLALLGGNLIAGLLWDHYGPFATFFVGAGITAVALAGLVALQGSGLPVRNEDEG
ncbi:MAG: MFS transporter [Proteobacteria bacterium]|nr:MFS transporter [Pseudomonadota bacterium]